MKNTLYRITLFLLFFSGIAWIAYEVFYHSTPIPTIPATEQSLDLSIIGEEKETPKLNSKNIGIYLDDYKEIEDFEEMPQIVAWFDNLGNPPSRNKLVVSQQSKAYIPLITLQPTDIPLEELADGKYDQVIEDYFQELKTAVKEHQVLIRFAHEMEWRPYYKDAWYSWQGEGNENDYIASWKRLVKIGKAILPNVKFIWSPNRADEYSMPYYPGDDVVDYVSITFNKRFQENELYTSFEDLYISNGKKEVLESIDKPIFLSEIGVSSQNFDLNVSYLKQLFDYFHRDERIIGVVLFNYEDYSLTDKKEYRDLIMEEIKTINENE